MERLGATTSRNKENTASENFLEKATAYEQEISFLKKELQKAERKAGRLALWRNVDPRDEDQRLREAEDSLLYDQQRLRQLRSNGPREESQEVSTAKRTSSADVLDEEDLAEVADAKETVSTAVSS